jgi:hypothetical protein
MGLDIVGMQEVRQPPHGQHLLGGVADELAEVPVDPDQLAAERYLADADGGVVEQDAEPHF